MLELEISIASPGKALVSLYQAYIILTPKAHCLSLSFDFFPMDPSNQKKQNEPEEPRFLDFPHLPDNATQNGKPRLNKFSSTLTKDHDFPGAQVRQAPEISDESFHINLIKTGNAIRRWRAEPRGHEELPPRRSSVCLVGRESVQVS